MENLLSGLIKQLPLAYAYHEVLFNEQGEPADYIFLDVNEAFEEMTGLKRSDIFRRPVTEVLPGIRQNGFDWVDFYGRVAVTGQKAECTQYVDMLKRWYKVTAFSPKRGQFIALFLDITSEMSGMQLLERQKNEITALSSDISTIFNSTQDPMFLVDYDGGSFRYIRSNRAFQRATGFERQHIEGKTPVEMLGEETGRLVHSHYLQCFLTGSSMTYETEIDFPAGRQVWLTSLNPVVQDGQVRYLVGSSKNVLEYKQLQKEKDELLQRMQSMFSEHGAVMLIVNPQTGVIADANPAACEFYGYTKSELLSLNINKINMLSAKEVEQYRRLALSRMKDYFLFPHRLRSGEIRMVDAYSSPVRYGNQTMLFSIIFDVTDREKLREALYREKELLGITLNSIGDGVVTTDTAGGISSMNQAAKEMTGWSSDEACGRPFTEIFRLKSEVTGKSVENPIDRVLQTGKVVGLANHTVLLNRNDISVPIADSAAPIKDKDGRTLGVVMVFRDVSYEKEHKERIFYLSYHDVLTGLYNRRFIEEEMKRADVQSCLPLAVVMGDVNGLKITNDVFGHDTGDRLLQKVAEAITEACREEDIVSRWGGDEFLILMPHTTPDEAERVIRSIKAGCMQKSEGTLQLSVSLGYAAVQRQGENLQRALQEAEEWMYHQKLLEGKSYRNTIINTLLATLYEKSLETEEHAERLRENCHKMAAELRFSEKEMNELSLLAILHDIGKVGINQNILQKPAALTPGEWEEMKKHPEIGYRIAQNTPELSAVAEYILSHHERWDGSGYPSGLKGTQIPLMCRILAIADAYDAMTNDRVYRKARSREEAVAELERNAGTQFDPNIISIFKTVMSRS